MFVILLIFVILYVLSCEAPLFISVRRSYFRGPHGGHIRLTQGCVWALLAQQHSKCGHPCVCSTYACTNWMCACARSQRLI